MSQQYGPPPGPPPAAAPGGWGAAPGGPGGAGPAGPGGWGPGPGRPQGRPAKSNRSQLIIIGCAVLAVVLVAVGVVLLVTGGGGDDKPAAVQTPDAPGTYYTPPAGSQPDDSQGPNDVGVKVGRGIWFTPARHIAQHCPACHTAIAIPDPPGDETDTRGYPQAVEHGLDDAVLEHLLLDLCPTPERAL